MDAIVTIQILDGKKAVFSTETAVEIHPVIANEITDCPDTAACWILGQAREKVHADGVTFTAAKSEADAETHEDVIEPELEPEPATEAKATKKPAKIKGE